MRSPKTSPHHPTQLLFDWPTAAVTGCGPSRPTPEGPSNEVAVAEPPRSAAVLSPQESSLVQVLPWDFRHSFPEPLDEAIDAGKLHEDDVLPESLEALHAEHAREMLATLATLDAMLDARRRGVDPSTGKMPRTQGQREALEKRFREEPVRLEHAFQVLLDVYAEAFGAEAAAAFDKAVRAWHAGVQVVSDRPPAFPPLPRAVEAGVFGQEEDGGHVDPGTEEVEAVTELLTDRLRESTDEAVRQKHLSQYAEDFGANAARVLAQWVDRRDAAAEQEHEYPPDHPWHYYEEGDGAEPLPLVAIEPATPPDDAWLPKLPKEPANRSRKLEALRDEQRRRLAQDEQRYSQLVTDGVDAVSQNDRQISHTGDDELAWASALALTYNHVRLGRGRLRRLDELIETTR